MCAFKTPPCVPGKRPHVLNMRAFSGYTRRRPERTHGGVLNPHTEGFSAFSSLTSSLFPLVSLSLLSCVSLSPLVCLSSHTSLFLSVSAHLFLSLLFSSLKTLSIAMTMVARPVGSLCTHGSILPEGQSAWALSSFPVWRGTSHHAEELCRWCSCASFVPIGM